MSKVFIRFKFGQVPVGLLDDPDISLKAKGLFAFIQSKPDEWEFSADKIAKHTKDVVDAVASAIRELEKNGFLLRVAHREGNGTFIDFNYFLLQTKKEYLPSTDVPVSNNTDISETKKKTKRKSKTDKYKPDWISDDEWSSLIEARKFKKLQNSKLALKTFCNSLHRGLSAGYTVERMIGEFAASRWTRFNHEWIKGDYTPPVRECRTCKKFCAPYSPDKCHKNGSQKGCKQYEPKL